MSITGTALPTSITGTTLVIGASGTTGGRTAAQLIAAGRRVKAASRRATPVPGAEPVRFDWGDPETHVGALDGVDRVYLIPPPGDFDPASVMLPFLRQARAAGVRRAVLLSSSAIPEGGPAVGMVHQALPGLFDEWAVLRPSWFMQNFTGAHAHADSIRADGTILTAAAPAVSASSTPTTSPPSPCVPSPTTAPPTPNCS